MIEALTELDVIYARSRHAKWFGGVKPRFIEPNQDPFQVHIPSALHPLLLERSMEFLLPKAPSLSERTFSEGFQQSMNSLLASFEEQEEDKSSPQTPPQSLDLTIPWNKRVVALTGEFTVFRSPICLLRS